MKTCDYNVNVFKSDADSVNTDHTITSGRFPAQQRNSASSIEAGLAVSADRRVASPSEEQRASPLPSRAVPGYIPGMNRPMTPRDYELDDRSHSTTPRATSPIMSVFNDSKSPSPSSGASGLGRKESISAATVRQSPRSNTPSLFLQRSPSANGRHTPEDGLRRSGSGDATEFESPSHSSLLARRRPTSPLSNLAASSSATNSRPGTPSNVVWQPSRSESISPTKPTHAKNDSWTSDNSGSEMILATTRYVHPPQRSVASPPLPDSPPALQPNFPILGHTRRATPPPDRTQSFTSANGNDPFSSNRSQRSPTPTQNAPRSPSSPGFMMDRNGGSRRSSRQQTASPFNFSSAGYTAPMLNIFDNSSRTSIASMGSSYHSWEGDKDDMDWYDSILSGDEPQTVWHDLNVGRTESPLSEEQAEELLKKYFGLTIGDMGTIQERLVGYASAKEEGSRKRKMSVSQSANAPARVCFFTPNDVSILKFWFQGQ
jgi:serine/arginine repetitive matrix protein 2